MADRGTQHSRRSSRGRLLGALLLTIAASCGSPTATTDAGSPADGLPSGDTGGGTADGVLPDVVVPAGDTQLGELPDVTGEPTPLLVVEVTPSAGGSGSGGGVSVEVPAGAVEVPTTLAVYDGPGDGAVSGLEPALDPLTTLAAPLRFEPAGTTLLLAATVTVSVPAAVGPQGARAAILRRAPNGTWTLAGDPGAPAIGLVVPGPAVRYPLMALAAYAVAVVPAERLGCIGAGAVSCSDGDGDGTPDVSDLCPTVADPAQGDADGDGVGDACDLCRDAFDPAQADADGNGVGDACDLCWPAGGPVQCDDGKPCNGVESCDPAAGCVAGEAPAGCCTTSADCDDGNACNGAESCGDDATCQAGTPLPCDDGNACNGAETCDPATGCVAGAAPVCSDGNICNGVESCDPASGCVAGTPLSCADDSACTLEQCDAIVGCVTKLVVCDDGNLCNGVETCAAAVGCVAGTPPACNDGNPCNGLEVCDPGVGCVIGDPPAGCCKTSADCDDGNPCNGSGVCDSGTGQCVVTPPPTCSDGNACNGAETCDPALGCVAGVPPTCDDDNVCNGTETCDPLLGCVAGPPPVCTSSNLCAGVAVCDPQLGCVAGPPLHCDDANVCNGVEVCDPVSGCVGGVPLLCDDGLPCNGQESCDPTTGCVPGKALPGCCTDGAPCDDQNPCNGQWTCGTATGTCELLVQPPGCFSGNACGGVGYCHPVEGCLVTTKLECSDGNACNGAEVCDEALGCVAGPPPTCDDGNACDGAETCDPTLGCVPGTPPVCADGNVCNGLESCSPQLGCVPGQPVDCQDAFACTDDACDPILGCSHVASAACSLVVTVTPETGGSAQAVETELSLIVPGGAVTEPVTITVEAAPWLDGATSQLGEVVRSAHTFEPDGATFAAPITVTLPAPAGAVAGDSFPVLMLSPDGGVWIHATHLDGSAVVGVAGGDPLAVTLTLDHFTDYGLGEGCDTCCAADADCDDGLPCTRDECVDQGCVSTDDATLCEDGDPCTDDLCSGGQCAHPAGTGGPCDDGDACTAGDLCFAGLCEGAPVLCDGGPGQCSSGTCVAGDCVYGPDDGLCDDSDPCTLDTCGAGGHCAHAPGDGPCDDGDPCTTADACDQGDCMGVAVPCDDADPCTDDACVEGACAFVPRACDDGVSCTTDACEGGACTHTPDDGACDDTNACTIDTCLLGVGCSWADGATCDDANPCTTDVCAPADGSCSTVVLVSKACDDDDKCTSSDVCGDTGGCQGTPIGCSDGNPCTDDVCDAATGACSHSPACDDGVACTLDSCNPLLGGCSSTPNDGLCDDGDLCTADTCTTGGCEHAPSAGACDDGDPCTADTCFDNACTHEDVGAVVCDDHDTCTADVCDHGGCTHDDVGAALCDDGDLCTTDTCADSVCAHGDAGPTLCDDGDVCTADTCVDGGCVNDVAASVPCDDDDACTSSDACSAGGLCVGDAVTCNDGTPCTQDGCDSVVGCTFAPVGAVPCNDGDLCTKSDTCQGAACVGKVKCDDGDVCTDDACDPATGVCSAPPTHCDDGDPCTLDACTAGVGCTYSTAPDCVDSDGDGSPDVLDCAPIYASIFPGATETCDQRDENCDGQVDEGACGVGDPCTQTDQCTTALCLEATPGGPRVCATAQDDCIFLREDGTGEVAASGAVGCATAEATGTCEAGVWTAQTACPLGTPWCAAGACADCVPGTGACAGDQPLRCSDDGHYEAAPSCAAGQTCIQGGLCAVLSSKVLPQDVAGAAYTPDSALTPDDRLLVVWRDNIAGTLNMRWLLESGEPDPDTPSPVVVAEVTPGAPHVAVTAGGWTMVLWKQGARIYSPARVGGEVFDPYGGDTPYYATSVAAIAGDRFVVAYTVNGTPVPYLARIRLFEKDGTQHSSWDITDPAKIADVQVIEAWDGAAILSWTLQYSPGGVGFQRLRADLTMSGKVSVISGTYSSLRCAGLDDAGVLCSYRSGYTNSYLARYDAYNMVQALGNVGPSLTGMTIVDTFAAKGGVGLVYEKDYGGTYVETYGGDLLDSEGSVQIGSYTVALATRCRTFRRGHVACVAPASSSANVVVTLIGRPPI